MKVTSQIFSLTSVTPMLWPAKTALKLILRRPMQMRPQLVTVMVRSWNGEPLRYVFELRLRVPGWGRYLSMKHESWIHGARDRVDTAPESVTKRAKVVERV
jgi:hypothetical protein